MKICEKYGSISSRSKLLTVNRKTVINRLKDKKNQRQKKCQELSQEVGDFFEKTATTLPDKKLVKKGKARQELNRPLKDLHNDYVNQGGKAAFSTFAKRRPAHVRKMMANQLRQCLCEYCANVDNKLFSLNSISIPACKIRHVYHAVEITTCPNSTKDCHYRQCGACGVDKLDDYLAPLINRKEITWYVWATKKLERKGKEMSKKVLLKYAGTVKELVTDLKKEVAFLSGHLFRAAWQHCQFEKVRTAKPFPPNLITAVMDFAENYTCLLQDEVQAAHWNKEQVTIHPISTYYRCNTCDGGVYESLIFVSPDLRHDHHAVHTFFTLALNHLRVERSLDPQIVLQWSDGCSSQYKSKGPFADITACRDDFGTRVERSYFGSRHGKGPCDGEAAVVKHHVATAVTGKRAVVTNAEEFFAYAQASSLNKQPISQCQHFRRTFFWVPEGMVNRDRPERVMKTVCGSREFHYVKSGGMGRLISRHLSCMCEFCLHGEGACPNTAVVGEWMEHSMARAAPGQRGGGRGRKPGKSAPRGISTARGRPQAAGKSQPSPAAETRIPEVPPGDDTSTADVHQMSIIVDNAASEPSPSSEEDGVTRAPQRRLQPRVLTFNDERKDEGELLARTNADLVPDTQDDLQASSSENPMLMTNSQQYRKGDYVKVTFQAGRTTKEFIGKVIDLEGEEVHVSFLRDRGGYYTYPQADDFSWVHATDITRRMDHPFITQRGQYYFQ